VRRSMLLFMGVLLAAVFGCHSSNQQVAHERKGHDHDRCEAKHAQGQAACERDDDDNNDDDDRERLTLADNKETNSWMVRSIHDASKTEALLAQRTLYPHYFVIDSAALNELGRRELDTLAKHYREYGGRLHVERADASDELYAARLASVADRLAAGGVDPARILRPEGRPGGAGIASQRMLLILRREAAQPGFRNRSGSSDEFRQMGSSGAQSNGAESGAVR
jgi:hypothetical protein